MAQVGPTRVGGEGQRGISGRGGEIAPRGRRVFRGGVVHHDFRPRRSRQGHGEGGGIALIDRSAGGRNGNHHRRRIARRDGRLGAGGRRVQGDPGRKAPAGRAQGQGESLVALGLAIVRRRHADGLAQVSPARVGGEGQRGITGRGGEIVRHRRVA